MFNLLTTGYLFLGGAGRRGARRRGARSNAPTRGSRFGDRSRPGHATVSRSAAHPPSFYPARRVLRARLARAASWRLPQACSACSPIWADPTASSICCSPLSSRLSPSVPTHSCFRSPARAPSLSLPFSKHRASLPASYAYSQRFPSLSALQPWHTRESFCKAWHRFFSGKHRCFRSFLVLSSFSCGIALLLFSTSFVEARYSFVRPIVWLCRADSIAIVLEAAFLAAYLAWGFNAEGTRLAVEALVAGDLRWLFWAGLVVCGLAVPFALERFVTHGNYRTQLLWIGTFLLAGGFVLRYCIVGTADYDVTQMPDLLYGLAF